MQKKVLDLLPMNLAYTLPIYNHRIFVLWNLSTIRIFCSGMGGVEIGIKAVSGAGGNKVIVLPWLQGRTYKGFNL